MVVEREHVLRKNGEEDKEHTIELSTHTEG